MTFRAVQTLRQDRFSNKVPGMARAKDYYMLVVNTQFHSSTDPRDKAFALLNLMDVEMEVDYSLSVEAVYNNLVITCRGVEKELPFLTWAGIGWNENKTDNLPSGVADW
jgi:hypothetical protein